MKKKRLVIIQALFSMWAMMCNSAYATDFTRIGTNVTEVLRIDEVLWYISSEDILNDSAIQPPTHKLMTYDSLNDKNILVANFPTRRIKCISPVGNKVAVIADGISSETFVYDRKTDVPDRTGTIKIFSDSIAGGFESSEIVLYSKFGDDLISIIDLDGENGMRVVGFGRKLSGTSELGYYYLRSSEVLFLDNNGIGTSTATSFLVLQPQNMIIPKIGDSFINPLTGLPFFSDIFSARAAAGCVLTDVFLSSDGQSVLMSKLDKITIKSSHQDDKASIVDLKPYFRARFSEDADAAMQSMYPIFSPSAIDLYRNGHRGFILAGFELWTFAR